MSSKTKVKSQLWVIPDSLMTWATDCQKIIFVKDGAAL
jgi:hypothetical protein